MNLFKKNKKVSSSVINNLEFDKKANFYKGVTYINKFKSECEVIIEGATIEYADKCINYLNEEIEDEIFAQILEYLVKYCNYYVEDDPYIDIPVKLSKEEVLDYIKDISIQIYKPERETIGFVILGDCAWNIEEGFAIVINDNKIKYVGPNEKVYNPWAEYDCIFQFDD